MKLLFCLALAVLFAAPCAFAQDIDPALQQAITNALPPAYAGVGALALILIAGVFRYFTARKNGLSAVDALLATLKGTNTPTKPLLLIGCLSMLTLSSCAGVAAFLASPAGQATFALADLGLNAAVAKGKIAAGDNVAIQRGLAIVTNPALPNEVKVFSVAELGLSAAVSKGLIKPGDALLIQEGAAIIKSAVTVPQVLEAKQPVNLTPRAAEAGSQRPTKCQRSQQGTPGLQNAPSCLLSAQTFRHAATPANDAQGEPVMPLCRAMKQSGGGVSIPLYGLAVAAHLAAD